MATSVSSYKIIIPSSRKIVMVNAQPSDRVDKLLIINPSPTQKPTIHCYEDLKSVLLNDYSAPNYTTHLMELQTNNGLVTGLISLDASYEVDHETCVMITSYLVKYHESLCANDLSKETICGNIDEEEEEVDVCAICLQEFEMDETCVALECQHVYHKRCFERWLLRKHSCPVCRDRVYPFLSKLCLFRVGS